MKVCFVISSLGPGGAERVMSIIANALVRDGSQVAIVTLDQGVPFYPIDSAVVRSALGLLRPSSGVLAAIANNSRRLWTLRRAIATACPDVVVSFGDRTNILSAIATLGLRKPLVLSERTDPRHHQISLVWRIARRLSYGLADAVVVQTERVATWARALVPRDRVRVIANPVSDRFLTTQRKASSSGVLTILGVGRLQREKGFDLLLRAFSSVAQRHPLARLRLVGEGSARVELEDQVVREGLLGRVEFVGHVHAVEEEFAAADVFVLCSRYEGFPNALLEAMAAGCAVVAADCPSGPAELIAPGSGLLVPPEDPAALAQALDSMLSDSSLRATFGEAAREVAERYAAPRIVADWRVLLGLVRQARAPEVETHSAAKRA